MEDTKVDTNEDAKVKMYVRIKRRERALFKAVADISGEGMEERLCRLMREDVQANYHLLVKSTAAV